MTPPATTPPEDAQPSQRMRDYLALSPNQQAVVNLLAVNWDALALSQIKAALGIPAKTRLDLAPLEAQGLLVRKRSSASGNTAQCFACHPALIEQVARRLAGSGEFAKYAELARQAYPVRQKSGPGAFRFESPAQLVRETRIGLYQGDEAHIERMFAARNRDRYEYWGSGWDALQSPDPVYATVCLNPFDAAWFGGLPAGIRKAALPGMADGLVLAWELDDAAYTFLSGQCQELGVFQPSLIFAALLRGEPGTAADWLAQSGPPQPDTLCWMGLLNWLRGDPDAAIKRFEEALRLHRKQSEQRKSFLPGVGGVFYILALALRNQGKDLGQALSLVELVSAWSAYGPAYRLLKLGLQLENDPSGRLEAYRHRLEAEFSRPDIDPWSIWIGLLVLHRYDAKPASFAPYLRLLAGLRERAEGLGLAWLAAELGQLQARLQPEKASLAEVAERFRQSAGLALLVDRVHYEAPWERALNAIRNAANVAAPTHAAAPGAELRLAWLVYAEYGDYALEVREQKRTGQGWSKGKQVSFKNLLETARSRPYLSAQDRQAIAHIVQDPYTRGYSLSERGWLALAGHPAVFWLGNGAPVDLSIAPPELRVRQQKDGQVRIEFWPKHAPDEALVITKEGLNRLRLTELKPEHWRVAAIVGEGVTAPASAQARILEGLGGVSAMLAIHSEIGTGEVSGAESVEADARPRVQLAPEGEGLRVAMLARPFGDRGAHYLPGQGAAGLITEIDGRRLQTQRDLKQERQRAADLVQSCPSLQESADPRQPFQWAMPDAESSLSLLLELGAAGPEQAVVEWPQGEAFKLAGQAKLEQVSLRLRQQRDWFSVDGELRLDDGEVLRLHTLLGLLDAAQGCFVRLEDGRFLALTDAFRKRLEDLRAFSEPHGQGRRAHPLALPAFEGLAEEVGTFQADAAWRKRLEQLRAAGQLMPTVPSTLQAELRDYQREGYVWLARLAAWGVGACLADDMGLGKTVQAIALILSRASLGPSLVIAPTSVGFNWHNEVARFAPTLNLRSLGSDRQQLIDSLGPMDLLVCSYGLLQQEAVGELLAKVHWSTLVLDEAQAIKNAATKRSQQAMALQAGFKLITTGTPVENHLGELWNLFRFINPGLLGSLDSFNQRFAGPIERSQDRDARQRLKRLIQPFILRRTKAQVLEELPPRTEIELGVELGEQEAAFYEALRRKLLEDLDEAEGPAEAQRFRVLAAITKLRRACCNPSLVAPDLGIPSSKLALLGEVLEELLANRHKALVFSQFVDHLSLVRAYLDEKGVAYQYLDGQTPAPDRKRRVEAFQAGQGEVFLISLKAGGTGLNLTAADYVIHLDPWWNPAVEDQASDRAHRIGQARPVTVYRLVAKGTIEEKIVALHRHKRELADSLLEGGDLSAKVGAEDLLALMRAG